MAIAGRCGFRAGLNDPFAAGTCRAARQPARGVHALQIELDRRLYLDEALAPGPDFDRAAI